MAILVCAVIDYYVHCSCSVSVITVGMVVRIDVFFVLLMGSLLLRCIIVFVVVVLRVA